jgi:stage V sporulation protein G
MEITEVRVRLVKNRGDRLKAFCSMTFDNEFVVRDVKIIQGASGYFIAMPSRKMEDHCHRCGGKNHLRAKFCNSCGAPLPRNRTTRDSEGRPRLHADIAHPINAKCRQHIEERVMFAFQQELEDSKRPDYKLVDIEDLEDEVPDMPR